MYFAYHVIWCDTAFKHTCDGFWSSGKAMRFSCNAMEKSILQLEPSTSGEV